MQYLTDTESSEDDTDIIYESGNEEYTIYKHNKEEHVSDYNLTCSTVQHISPILKTTFQLKQATVKVNSQIQFEKKDRCKTMLKTAHLEVLEEVEWLKKNGFFN